MSMKLQLRGLGDTSTCTSPTTPGFQAWFNGSVVVDSHGCPLVVWHGHPIHVDPFEWFDFDRAADIGMHFGTQAAAGHFGNPRPFYLALRRPIDLRDPGDWLDQRLTSASEVPVLDELATRGLISEGEYEHAIVRVMTAKRIPARQGRFGEAARREGRAAASRIIRELIEAKGYDGVTYQNLSEDYGSRSWIAFHPWQIKNIYAKRFARTSNIFDGLRGLR